MLTDEQLQQKVGEKLEALNFSGDEVDQPETEVLDNKPAEFNEPVVKETGEVSAGETSVETELSDGLRRAAIHQGWTPDEIDSFYKEKPELAKKTFSKIHESTNRLSDQFAEIGRKAMQPPTTVPTQPAESNQQTTAVRGIDLTKLRDEYGDDPIVDVVNKLNDEIVRLTTTNQPLKSQPVTMDQNAMVQDEVRGLISGQIDQFFKTMGTSDNGHYGADKPWKECDKQQVVNRMNMLKQADQIRVGAAAHGQRISNDEAMTRAHILYTSKNQAADIRADIKSTLQKRQNNLTIEPANNLSISEQTGTLSEKDVLGRAKKRLQKLFKN